MTTGKIQVFHNLTFTNEFQAHTDTINQLKLLNGTGRERRVASASKDTTVKIWNTTDWNLIATFTGHMGSVYTIEQINDTTMASSSFDTSIQVWTINKVKRKGFYYLLKKRVEI